MKPSPNMCSFVFALALLTACWTAGSAKPPTGPDSIAVLQLGTGDTFFQMSVTHCMRVYLDGAPFTSMQGSYLAHDAGTEVRGDDTSISLSSEQLVGALNGARDVPYCCIGDPLSVDPSSFEPGSPDLVLRVRGPTSELSLAFPDPEGTLRSQLRDFAADVERACARAVEVAPRVVIEAGR
jgi:hypothetical protein